MRIGKWSFVGLCWLLIALLTLNAEGVQTADEDSLAPTRIILTHVQVVDVLQDRVLTDQVVVIDQDQITQVVPFAQWQPDSSATPIDLTGKYVIPGLWDMHIHWYHTPTMALFPINGVTGVRVMWGMPMHHNWRDYYLRGDAIGPDMVIASPIIDGPQPVWPNSLVASDAETAQAAIERSISTKADFLKVYSLLPRDAYFAIVAEARKKEIPFVGHVPYTVSVAEASDAGQKSMEHLYELFIACSSDEDELRRLRQGIIESGGTPRALYDTPEQAAMINRRAVDTFDPQKAQRLFEKLAANGTRQCPTLTVLRNLAFLETDEVQMHPDLKYLNPAIRSMIAPAKDPRGRSAEQFRESQRQFELQLRLLKQMHDANVPILAGTDCLNPFCLPGFSLHTELELMVRAGLSPLAAIKTATINPARFLNRDSELGSVSAGKRADLVVLDADPTRDIRHTKQIQMVILRGQVFSRADLDAQLDDFEESGK